MSKETTFKKSLSGSVGAGMGSLLNGKGKTYFILEHKVSSKYHRAGEGQEIIVDQVELGRDSSCAVQFDESFTTVSRHHAAIVRDGDKWKLIQLSKTNQTFLNGHPIQKEWYLQNGDEIQLSVNGPKLGFIVPQGNKSTVGSIGLSRRLSLFRQQALKPYKTAMSIMAAVLVLVIGLSTWWGIESNNRLNILLGELADAQAVVDQAQEEIRRQQAYQDSIQGALDKLEKDNKRLRRDINNLVQKQKEETPTPSVTTSNTGNKDLNSCEGDVYYIVVSRIQITYNGETRVLENVCTGTGFLLNDGKFVTARHVVEPWMFPSSDEDTNAWIMNAIACDDKVGKVVSTLECYSPKGKHLTFISERAIINRQYDKQFTEDGITFCLPQDHSLDWAYFNTNERGSLVADMKMSTELPVRTKLSVLGYPLGIGANSKTDIHPIYSEATVAREGLEKNYILTTATTFEHGNSGGPVFASTNKGMFVVGIVSAGAGRSTGLVIPIASLNR